MTAGPTHEPIDPVRYIANRSSGKQGYAIAAAAAAARRRGQTDLAARWTFPIRASVDVITRGIGARHAGRRCRPRCPADCAIFAAAVADWRVADAGAQKIKKQAGGDAFADAGGKSRPARDRRTVSPTNRPRLVVGFAAETENLIANAQAKSSRARAATGSSPTTCRLRAASWAAIATPYSIVTRDGVESWPAMDKNDVATALVARIASTH